MKPSFPGSLLLPDGESAGLDLLPQVAWFNRLRLLAAVTVVWLTALAAHALDVLADPVPLYVLACLIAAVDGAYILYFPRLTRLPQASVRRHVYLQIAVDLAILTAILHFTGGITNPVALFYLFHAFIAALVLSVRAAVVVGFASLALVVLLGMAERLGWIPHHALPLGLVDLARVRPLGFWLLLLAYSMTLAFSIYFVATVLGRLRRNEAQLVRMSRQLAHSEKLASIGTLAAGVSHEINNPVGVIRSKVEILRYRIQDGDAPDLLLGELGVVERHVQRIAQVTAGLLAFSRETPFQLQPVDANALAREAAELVRVPFAAAGVSLDLELAPVPLRVQGSANHLLQVLINILVNARDASPQGARVVLRTLVRGGEAVLAVVDQGTGMPPGVQAKIFDPFFTTKDVDKGTGLGLAISHGIVERHGGRIDVQSAPGAGSTFEVVLPIG
ncbi:MAG: hypothetical protein RL148_1961 [Planctomycetota bacterium]|jgi:signal transduction histidine kinase